MGIHRSMMVTGALVALLGCSGPNVRYDYDARANFAGYRTFAWQGAPRGGSGEFDNPIMKSRVQRTVMAALAAKGFQEQAGAEPDFLVTSYPVIQSSRSHQAHVGVGFGLGPVGLGVAGPVGDRRREWVGGLVLEIQDFRTHTVVWKATADAALQSSDNPEEADAAVKSAVDGMLRRFPPKS
jgi:hypothetical protein